MLKPVLYKQNIILNATVLQLDVYERPRSRWLALRCKPGKTKTDYRGEIEVTQ